MGPFRGVRAAQFLAAARLFTASSAQLHNSVAPAPKVFLASNAWHAVRHMSSDISELPELSDPQAKRAFNELLATNWSKIDKQVYEDVEAAIARSDGDGGVLSTVWSSAQASEKFAETLLLLKDEFDELSGSTGEEVGRLPDALVRALEAALRKYNTYVDSIDEQNEAFLRKKIENDLGNILVQIKQRCSGLEPKWGRISLLGTSGLSGSYIERRSAP